MWIRFYTDERLRYTSRKRYVQIPDDIQPSVHAQVQSFVYGDGVNTEFVWNAEDRAVTVEDSWLMEVTYFEVATSYTDATAVIHYGKWHRWFVTGYEIENGGCVRFQLLRDVVGEFGLDGIYGKVERGFAKGIFEHRKELSLNQILVDRKRLVPDASNYGSITVLEPARADRNEVWGILYMKKPAPLPDTPAPTSYNIPIPGFAPAVSPSCPDNLDGNKYYISQTYTRQFDTYFRLKLRVKVHYQMGSTVYEQFPENDVLCHIRFNLIGNGADENNNPTPIQLAPTDGVEILYIRPCSTYTTEFLSHIPIVFNTDADIFAVNITDMGMLRKAVVEKLTTEIGARYVLECLGLGNLGTDLSLVTYPKEAKNWNGAIYIKDYKYYRYSATRWSGKDKHEVLNSAKVNTFLSGLSNRITFSLGAGGFATYTSINCVTTTEKKNPAVVNFKYKNYTDYSYHIYKANELTQAEAGNLTITPNQDYVDEPYSVIVTPLFDCKIKYNNVEYVVKRDTAFNVFNHVIAASSGENSYLVDAQLYPYCPIASDLVGHFEMKKDPQATASSHALFFSVASTSYNYDIHISLDAAASQVAEGDMPYPDIKKTYMTRLYSIVSPDKSAKFDFNLYDYKDILSNFEDIVVTIKTALKPFAIISSAIIQPEEGSLIGLKYNSDMRGCNPACGGFECSIATDMFEQYKRQNSNYQQIFALQRGELQVAHDTERVNEKTNAIVNTMTATAMGAIGGGAVGGSFGPIGKGIGAAVGGIAAGATVGTAMYSQYKANEKLRDYEENLQQQNFDLQIGTVKNLPNSVTRISSFNEIIMSEFNYYIETYVCSPQEEQIVDEFRRSFGDQIGALDYYTNHYKPGCFLRGTVIRCNLLPSLQTLLVRELEGGIYYYGLTAE